MGGGISNHIKKVMGRTLFPFVEKRLSTRFAIGKPCIPVLMFHQIVPTSDYQGNLWTILEKERFAEICKFVSEHFSSILSADLPRVLKGEVHTSKPPILLTFDDGWFDNLSHALPLLKTYQLRGIIFVTTGYLGSSLGLWPEQLYLRVINSSTQIRSELADRLADLGVFLRVSGDPEEFYGSLVEQVKEIPDDDRRSVLQLIERVIPASDEHGSSFENLFKMLDWPDLRTLIDSGIVEIGLHTHTHPILSNCSYQRVLWEVEENIKQLRFFGIQHSKVFAYPNGGRQDFGEREVDLVKDQLFVDLAFSTIPGYVTSLSNPHSLPRIGIGRGQGVDFLKYVLLRQLSRRQVWFGRSLS